MRHWPHLVTSFLILGKKQTLRFKPRLGKTRFQVDSNSDLMLFA